MKPETKQVIVRYVHSSLITFLGIFLPLLLLELQDRTFDDWWTLGIAGVGGVICRLVIKSVYESVKYAIPSLIEKLKKKK